MYNDYYLQQIDSKLNTIIDNQEDIILQNHTLISGDSSFYIDFNNFSAFDKVISIWYIILFFSLLFYLFYKGIFKGR